MKQYEKLAHISVSSDKIDEFTKLVGDAMEEYQSLGLQVEVQYQHSMSSYSALILGYKEVIK
jgi:hypothetical protein